MRLLGCAAAAAAFLAAAPLAPSAAQEVSCDDIDLVFAAASSSTPYCWAAEETGRNSGEEGAGGWRAGWEIMAVKESDFYAVVQLIRAGMRTYLDKGSVREEVDNDSWFDLTRGWGEAYEVDRFAVADFEATWGGYAEYWICRGFIRYERPVANSPGYQVEVRGSYCVAPSVTLSPDRFARFLDSITY